MPGTLNVARGDMESKSKALANAASTSANANTEGYMPSEEQFVALVGGGVATQTVNRFDEGGAVKQTGNGGDFCCTGVEFIPVKLNDGTEAFVKSASSSLDHEGFLRTHGGTGQRILGMPIPAGGLGAIGSMNGSDLVPVQLEIGDVEIKTTTEVKVACNLPANAVQGTEYTLTTNVYGSLGRAHALNLRFTSQGPGTNLWNMSILDDAGQGIAAGQPGVVIPVNFNNEGLIQGAGGVLPSLNLAIDWPAPAAGGPVGSEARHNIQLHLGNVTQRGQQYVQGNTTQDGSPMGFYQGFTVADNGVVSANYSGGQVKELFVVPLARFANPGGMQRGSGTSYKSTSKSGALMLSKAGSEGSFTSQSVLESAANQAQAAIDAVSALQGIQMAGQMMRAGKEELEAIRDALR